MKKSSNNILGCKAMQSEEYKLPIESHKELMKMKDSWWSRTPVVISLTIFMSAMDALVLYDVLGGALNTNRILAPLISFGFALLMNVIPLVCARFVIEITYGMGNRFSKLYIIVLVITFFLIFSSTVYLRFANQDVFSGSDYLNQAAVAVDESDGIKDGTMSIAVLLSLEPMVTAIIAFFFGMFTGDVVKKMTNYYERRRLELREYMVDLECVIANKQEDVDRCQKLKRLDDDNFDAVCKELICRGNRLKGMARHILADYLDNKGASYVLSTYKASDALNETSITEEQV